MLTAAASATFALRVPGSEVFDVDLDSQLAADYSPDPRGRKFAAIAPSVLDSIARDEARLPAPRPNLAASNGSSRATEPLTAGSEPVSEPLGSSPSMPLRPPSGVQGSAGAPPVAGRTATPTPAETRTVPTATPPARGVSLVPTDPVAAPPVSPVETPEPAATPVPPTPTFEPSATPRPTATRVPTATPVPPTTTAEPTATPVPPAATPQPTATPTATAEPADTPVPTPAPDDGGDDGLLCELLPLLC
jgi:hypothetical protein